VGIVSSPGFTDYGIQNGTTYYYVVQAGSEYGLSASSAQVNGLPAAFPGTVEILSPVAWGAAGTAYCPATGAFDEQPVWDSVAQKPAGATSGAGTSTATGYANRFWYVDFGPAFATLNITEMWTRYRWSSPGDQPGFGTFWWDDNTDAINSGITEPRMNFGSAQDVPGSGTERVWARDRDFGASPITPPKRYLIISTGPTPPSRPDEYAFVGYRNNAPVITVQPQSQAVSAGMSVTFSVTANGSPTPTYQWRKNAVSIAGATGSSYTIANISAADAADYSVVVTNSGGSVTSNNAALTVNSIGILTPAAWGQASGSGFCSAAGAFDEPPTLWDSVNNIPLGDSATPHSQTNTGYANRYWYIDFGADFAKVRITQMWTRYRPSSPGSFSGFASMWWDPNTDTVNDGTAADSAMNFATAQNVANVGTQLWLRDADFTSAPITPLHRYLIVSTGSVLTSRPNEFTFVGYRVP
jgi:hypothetical protein